MFRSKKKKTQGRKRRGLEEEIGPDTAAQDNGADAGEISAGNDVQEAQNELQAIEELRKSRSRAVKSSLSFSSKATSSRSVENGHAVTVGVNEGLLSFEEEGDSTKKRTKMRPNLMSADVEMEESSGQYSAEKLASLRSEQSVLPAARDVEMEEVMAVEEGNDEEVGQTLQEEEEEFISLEPQKPRHSKHRVTFGEQAEIHHLPKETEVVEDEMSGENEDDEQNQRWEEELMRRGGHRVPPPSGSNGSRYDDGLPKYPTRRKVPCVTLDGVLAKLEKTVESTSFEDDRASRELARLEAETALLETTLKQQREELLSSSEEFEYFQEVEDFVKGLSFCLREKVPAIEAKEKKFVEERVQRVEGRRQDDLRGIAEDVRVCLELKRLLESDVFGLDQLNLHSTGNTTAVVPPSDNSQRAARLHKYQQHFTETYTPGPSRNDEDLFSDAIDEISTLDRVYGRFQEWKAKFPQVYKNVYCELAQEKLYAPYVQAELLYWDPLGVADEGASPMKGWSLHTFSWLQVLSQHLPRRDDSSGPAAVDSPLLYQLNEVFMQKIRTATSSYFDPYSSLQARSLSLVLEEIHRHGYTPHVTKALQALITTVLDAFSQEAKRTVLIALDQATADACEDVNMLARFLVERFNTLQDNLLTLFVALPKGDIAATAFRCLLQVFHRLLAYVRHCQDAKKTHLVATATQVVRQLSGSSYLLQLLADPRQERELKHVMELFAPFLQATRQ